VREGDEYIVGQKAHTYRFEGGGAAVLASIQPQPIDFQEDGTLDLGEVARNIKPNDFHFARTRLLCLENTQEGRVLPWITWPRLPLWPNKRTFDSPGWSARVQCRR